MASDELGPPLAVYLYGAPEQLARSVAHLRGRSVAVFGREAEPRPLDHSFESAAEQLDALGRLYFEPDGSFAWTGTEPELWQMYGMLYDRAGQLQYVELRGRCPRRQWDRLMAVFGGDPHRLAVQVQEAGLLVPAGVFADAWWSPAPEES